MSDPGGTAQTLILVGIILQVIGILILLGLAAALPFIGVIFLLFALAGILWTILIYAFSYAPTARGDYEAARAPTLIFAILSFLTLAIIPGILYIVAYVELGNADSDEGYTTGGVRASPGGGSPYPGTPGYFGAPPTQPHFATPQTSSIPLPKDSKVCPRCGQPTLPQATMCRNCGLSFVPNQPAPSPTPVPRPQFASPATSSLPLPVGTRFCPQCGQPTTAQARFCRNCGSSLA